jgi:hypothetical protein
MASYRYNKYGQMTGYTRTSADDAKREKAISGLLVFGIVLLPFTPLMFLSYTTFSYIENTQHLHPVFAGLIAAIPTILVLFWLIKSRVFRYLYFGAESIGVSYLVYLYCIVRTDQIWSAFYAVLALLIGLLITYIVANVGFANKNS